MIAVNRSNDSNFDKIICSFAAKIFVKFNNLFEQLFLKNPTYVLCKISVVEYSYRSVNWIIF
jgi:hypothetical protein